MLRKVVTQKKRLNIRKEMLLVRCPRGILCAGGRAGGTYKTKKPRPTMALLMPHTDMHEPAVLNAAWVEKAESQMIAIEASTATMACGCASLRVRGNRGAMPR